MKKTFIPAAIVLILFSSSPAFAQSHGYGRSDNGPHGERDSRDFERGGPSGFRDDRRDDRRRDVERNGHFHKGDRLPMNYRHHQYVVNDWRGHHLRQPPRGHQWIQIGADYALMAIATGIVVDIVVNH